MGIESSGHQSTAMASSFESACKHGAHPTNTGSWQGATRSVTMCTNEHCDERRTRRVANIPRLPLLSAENLEYALRALCSRDIQARPDLPRRKKTSLKLPVQTDHNSTAE
eukprot:6198059-Pleurochrysis_carterae.AAC.4